MNKEEENTRTGAKNTVVNIKIMPDWKEEAIVQYRNLELKKQLVEGAMGKDLSISKLRTEIKEGEQQLEGEEMIYKADISACDAKMLAIKEELVTRWDTDAKSFNCDAGSVTMRTTRSLKIDNKEELINILQVIGKLTLSIKSWDLTLLRKLVDAELLDETVAHFVEKRNVVIGDEKK